MYTYVAKYKYGHTCTCMCNTCMTSVLVESYIPMYICIYTYVAKYKYGHTCTCMCNTCMTLSTSRVIHTYVHMHIRICW